MPRFWTEEREVWIKLAMATLDNGTVASFFIFGSIFTAVGLALFTDALHRRVKGDEPVSRIVSWHLKWQELGAGILFVVMGLTLLSFALTN